MPKPDRVEGRQIAGTSDTIANQLGQGFTGRRRIEDAPDVMAGGNIGSVELRYFTDQRKPILRHRTKQACRAMILSERNTGDSRSQIASRRSITSGAGVMVAGSRGSGTMSEKAVT